VGDRLAHGAVTRRPPISLNTMYHPVPGATRTTLGFGICPSFKDHSLSTQVCSAMKRYVPDSPEQIEFYLKEAVDNLLYMSSVLSHPEVHYEVCPALTLTHRLIFPTSGRSLPSGGRSLTRPFRDARRFPSLAIVARTGGYTYAAKVWALSIVQAVPEPFAPLGFCRQCQTLKLRFATFTSLLHQARRNTMAVQLVLTSMRRGRVGGRKVLDFVDSVSNTSNMQGSAGARPPRHLHARRRRQRHSRQRADLAAVSRPTALPESALQAAARPNRRASRRAAAQQNSREGAGAGAGAARVLCRTGDVVRHVREEARAEAAGGVADAPCVRLPGPAHGVPRLGVH
jgi:hypothetical protein